jgi:hypothetical protein
LGIRPDSHISLRLNIWAVFRQGSLHQQCDAFGTLLLKAMVETIKSYKLANLLDLNLELAELEAEGQTIDGP